MAETRNQHYRLVGPIGAAFDNYRNTEGHTLFQGGIDPQGRHEPEAFTAEYGDREEAQADWYRMRDYE